MLPNKIKEIYENGKTIDQISKLTEVHKSSTYRHLKLQGTTFRKVGRRPKVNPRTVSILRQQGLSYREIAKLLNMSHIAVFYALREYRGIHLKY